MELYYYFPTIDLHCNDNSQSSSSQFAVVHMVCTYTSLCSRFCNLCFLEQENIVRIVKKTILGKVWRDNLCFCQPFVLQRCPMGQECSVDWSKEYIRRTNTAFQPDKPSASLANARDTSLIQNTVKCEKNRLYSCWVMICWEVPSL